MGVKASIIYLTRNGGAVFRESLESVLSQEAPFEFEVIAVDSGSTDGTLEAMRARPVMVHSIKPDEFNFGLTRDYGFSLAKGEIVVTLSQDAVPVGKSWLKDIVAPFDDPSVAAVQARERLPVADAFYWLKAGLFYYTRECKGWIRKHGGIGLSFVCCAVRRSVWDANRLGQVEMSEDKVFQKKLREKGERIIMQEKAAVFHSHQYGIVELAKRCENEGLGWRNVGQAYSFGDMVLDFFNFGMMLGYLRGLMRLEMRRPAEFLFPLIRPVFIFKGNHFTKRYVR
ncbi:MAG: glycosyltransferase [Candidatus Methylomirabilis sp.]|nr:glycosyltransferase [Deltaproteobacteria bacterium]